MSDLRTIDVSFNGGIVSPEFFGRIDDRKYQTGLAKCLNAIVHPQGPVSNRGGGKFVREAKDSTKKTRVIPFAFSVTQTYAMELGHEYIRFHTMGGTIGPPGTTVWDVANAYEIGDVVLHSAVYYYCATDDTGTTPGTDSAIWYPMPSSPTALFEMPTPYQEDDLAELHYVQSNDIMTITHPGYPSKLVTRFIPNNGKYTAFSFKTASEVFGPSDTAEPTNLAAVVNPGSGTTPHNYGVTWIDAVTGEESLLTVTDDAANDLTIIANFNDLSWDAVSAASRYNIYRSDGGEFGFIGQTDLLVFKDNGIEPDFLVNPPIDNKPFNEAERVERVVNGTFDFDIANWTDASASGTITWDSGDQSMLLSLESKARQTLSGLPLNTDHSFIITTGSSGFLDIRIGSTLGGSDILSFQIGVPGDTTLRTVFNTGGFATLYLEISHSGVGAVSADDISILSTGVYPVEVTYFQQRKVFGGTVNEPQKLFLTKPGTESNLSHHIPAQDSDAIIFRPATREAVIIRHAIPLNDLIILTSASEWKVTSINSDALTPESTSIKTPTYTGAADVRPVLINNTIIFVADRGSHWQELVFNFEAGGYITSDMALRANHLFDGLTFIDMAYSKAPHPIVWSTRSDGRLIGFTYVPGQQVNAYHVHETSTAAGLSLIKHMCVVPEGDYDYIYAVVERIINGSTVKYIERFVPHVFDTAEDAYFVDCGVTYDIPITITGITQANPAVVTAVAHGRSNGDLIDLRDIISVQNIDPATLIQMDSLNGRRFKAANVTADTFELQTNEVTPVNVDTTDYTAYSSGGTARKAGTSVTGGLDHLEGEEVAILGNGAVLSNEIVTGGAITLSSPASIVHVGLPITTDIETLPLIMAVENAFQDGKERVIDKAWLKVHRSSGVSIGPDTDNLVEIKQRDQEEYGKPPNLVTGNMNPTLLTPLWNSEGRMAIQQNHPLPLKLLSVKLGVTLGD